MQTIAQHTPGPLHVVFSGVKRGYKGYRVETSAGYITAEIVEKEPDAYLYAAAPELLAALERAIPLLIRLGDFIGNGDIDTQRPGSLGARCDVIGDARAAIRKAKGE